LIGYLKFVVVCLRPIQKDNDPKKIKVFWIGLRLFRVVRDHLISEKA